MKAQTIVITGGHHSSALEVAIHLRSSGWTIVWFGHRHSMWGDSSDSAEYREVVASGIVFYDLLAGKFYRTFNPLKLLRITLGFIQAFLWLSTIRPAGIISFGGYLAVPTVFAAWLLGIPSITHEQTTVGGWANRVIAHFVQKICLTFPDDQSIFPKSKTVVVGLPLRSEILAVEPTTSSGLPTILITCGKQGSHVINEVIFSLLPRLLDTYQIIHQTGSSTLFNDYQTAQAIKSNLAKHLQSRYQVHDYLFPREQARALAQATLVISRAGAHITYELAFLGIPSILIPLPRVSHGEQWHNAQFLARHGLALIIHQSDLTPASLLQAIDESKRLSPIPLSLPTTATEKIVQIATSLFQ